MPPRVPLISIVLPTFNGAAYIRESVDSCLNQTLQDLELIVVIDGSTDGTEEILRSYSDERLHILKQSNAGLPSALNAGFSHARGQMLSWTSDDNMYFPRAMRAMAEYLQSHEKTPMVCTDFIVIDNDGEPVSYDQQNWACFLYRAEAAARAGPYRPEFRLVEDVDFFLRLQHLAGQIERIPEPYYKYRAHKASLSGKLTAKRQFVSLKLHYDLVTRGVEKLDLKELFFDRLRVAALYRDRDAMDQIVQFARDHNLEFTARLANRRDLLQTRAGWLWNRIAIASRGQMAKSRQRALLKKKLAILSNL